jgi:hypothetical protein
VKEQKRCQEIMDFKNQGDKYYRSSKHAEAAWSYGKAINVRASSFTALIAAFSFKMEDVLKCFDGLSVQSYLGCMNNINIIDFL